MYHLRHQEVQKAVDDFKGLIEQDPDNLLARLAVAEALVGVGQFDEALKQINLVIEKKPSALAYTLRARLWTQQEKLDEAVKDLDEAAKLEPADLGLVLMRARLYHAEGRNALAQQDVEQVLEDATGRRSRHRAAQFHSGGHGKIPGSGPGHHRTTRRRNPTTSCSSCSSRST